MFIPSCRFLPGALACAALSTALCTPAAAATDAFPSRPIRLIVPYAPGGGPDGLARKTAEVLAKELGIAVIVENKVGAGGMLAGEYATRATADGYTLMLGSSTHVTQKILQPAVNFDPVTGFTHIVRTGFTPQVLIVSTDSPYTSAQELIAAARQVSDPFNYASGGIGSAAHLAGAAFSGAAKANTMHIPYRGSVEIVPALLKGDVQFGFPTASTALPHIANGKVRALAVSSAQRLPQLPDVPTLDEVFQRDDLALDAWSGIWAPAGLPQPVLDKLEQAFKTVYATPEIKAFYEQAGTQLNPSASPADFTRFIQGETAKYQKVVSDNKIEVNP